MPESVNKHNNKFLYQKLVERIKNQILSGELKKNDRLPPKRKKAKELKSSINTVSNAYEQLIMEGYIYSVERSGYYVEDIPELLKEKKIDVNWNEILKEPNHIYDRSQYSLSHMNTNIDNFPYAEWRKCENIAFQNHKLELSRITDKQGLLSVRNSIARLIESHRSVFCEPEQIILGVGSQALIEEVLDLLNINTEIHLGVEDPGYTRLYNQLKHIGINLNPIKLDNKGISVDNLKKTNTNVVFVTPSHQFPTGIIMPVSRRTELLNWAAEEDNRYIIEDDYDSEFKYKTNYVPSLHNLDKNENVIYLGSFSKPLLPSLRVSYMVLPKKLVVPFRERYGHLIPENNTLVTLTLKYFIDQGYFNRHIKRMTHYYQDIRTTLISELKRKFKTNIDIHDSLAGLHFVADFKTSKTYSQVEMNSKRENIELYTLRRFMINDIKKEGILTIIIGFGTIQKDKIKHIVDKLYEIIM